MLFNDKEKYTLKNIIIADEEHKKNPAGFNNSNRR